MTVSELHALTQEALPKDLDRKLLSCLREGPDTRPHYRKDAGSTILQPHLLERSPVIPPFCEVLLCLTMYLDPQI